MFVSVRRSVLNWFTDDIGMNGVPIYTNALVRADAVWMRRTIGGDFRLPASIRWYSPGPPRTPLRLTRSLSIQRMAKHHRHQLGAHLSAKSFGVLSVSNSEQQQTINETHKSGETLGNAQVYYENSHDGVTTLKYDWTLQTNPALPGPSGGQASIDRMNYNVQQPIGFPIPYSADPTPGDATSIVRVFTPVSSAGYGQLAVELPHGMRLVAGERVSQWSIVGSTAATGKAVFFAPLFGRMSIWAMPSMRSFRVALPAGVC